MRQGEDHGRSVRLHDPTNRDDPGIDTLTLTGNHYKAGATLIMGADSVTHLTESGNVGDL